MDTLPNEVLDLVFRDLNLFQKQECMLVCSRWSNIIRSTSLFSTIHITRETTFNRITKVLDGNPSYRHQIQNLIIRDAYPLTLNENQLLHYFPSLNFFQATSYGLLLKSASEININLLVELESWQNQIEKMEIIWCPRGNTLLSLGVFSSLKRLVINNISSPSTFADIVPSAPNINTLVITKSRVSLNDLKSIHTGLKSLQHLTLENVELMPGGEINEVDTINPIRTLFISFRFTQVNIVVKWLHYITKNFNLLLNFKFIFPWTAQTVIDTELYITRNGLLPLILTLGHQLKYIEVNSSDGILDIIDTLDIIDNYKQIVHINTLFSAARKTFGKIPLHSQYAFIDQLTVNLNTVTRKSLSYLRSIIGLKKLSIGCMYQRHTGDKRLFLDCLLDNCLASLESLEVYDFDVCCQGTIFGSYPLKQLAIHSSSISPAVYQLISKSMPSLSRLTIDHHDAMNNNRIVLDEVDLQYLEVSLNRDCFILLSTLNNRMSRYYHFGPYKPSDMFSNDVNSFQSYEPINQTTFKTSPDPEIVLQLTCKCVKTFVVNKRLAF